MNKLNEFVTLYERSSMDCPMILHTKYPYIVGKVNIHYGDFAVNETNKTKKIPDFNASISVYSSLSLANLDDNYLGEILTKMAEYARQTVCVDRLTTFFRKSCENYDKVMGERTERKDERRRIETERLFAKKKEELFGK